MKIPENIMSMSVREFVFSYGRDSIVSTFAEESGVIKKHHQAAKLFDFLKKEEVEVFAVATLDSTNTPLGVYELSRGTLDETIAHPRDAFRKAFEDNASAIVIAHNHPSGDPTPSHEDLATTKRFKDAGEIVGIRLVDHIVISSSGFISTIGKI